MNLAEQDIRNKFEQWAMPREFDLEYLDGWGYKDIETHTRWKLYLTAYHEGWRQRRNVDAAKCRERAASMTITNTTFPETAKRACHACVAAIMEIT